MICANECLNTPFFGNEGAHLTMSPQKSTAFGRFPPYISSSGDAPASASSSWKEPAPSGTSSTTSSSTMSTSLAQRPAMEMYKGHKVVAMPSSSFNGMSVRDVVSSRTNFNPDRQRSLSAGRATTRSRDIVQEVYDRMGVSRPATTDPFDDTNGDKDASFDSPRGRSSAPNNVREAMLVQRNRQQTSFPNGTRQQRLCPVLGDPVLSREVVLWKDDGLRHHPQPMISPSLLPSK